jgi:hypothetical protein
MASRSDNLLFDKIEKTVQLIDKTDPRNINLQVHSLAKDTPKILTNMWSLQTC